MEIGAFDTAPLEIRRRRDGSRRLRGRFPYKKRAVLSDGGKSGRPQKEEFAPRAFGYRVDKPEEEIHLLVGHSFDKPLASKLNETLSLVDSDEALTFEATISPQIADTSYGADVLKQIESGLAVGISPGFRIPPRRAVPAAQAERFTDEGHDPARGMHNAVIRTIYAALLYELSIVTRPAYHDTQVEITDEDVQKLLDAGWTYNAQGVLVPPPDQPLTVPSFTPVLKRWRL